MVKWRLLRSVVLITFFVFAAAAGAEEAGVIRGMVYDKDSESPLAAAQVSIAETGKTITATDGGNYVFNQVEPGSYTLVFSKEGYARQVTANVVVSPGKITDADASLSSEVTEMEELVVQDMQMGGGTEAALLDLRVESPALMDSIGSELMSQAGASDAASALRLVAGATVQDGKYAVVRGLPDRYVSSQMNGVRLPTADADKRAVQLDQFPAAVIESIQVSKTFTPDQQGDASGGAVNIVTKRIPDETIFQASSELSWNTQTAGRKDFLTYKGGGLNYWGLDDGSRDIPANGKWDGAVGVSRGDSPQDYKWSLAAGGKHNVNDEVKVGGFGDFFYERKSSFFDNGIDDKYWVENPGNRMSPQYSQGTPDQGNFKTSLFDVTQGRQEVKWGTLGTVGLETENHSLNLTYLYTHDTEDVATLAEDTRGKAHYFPGYDPNDPKSAGNQVQNAAPYLRAETLEYTERTTQTVQLRGSHKLPVADFGLEKAFMFHAPELDWTVARSSSNLDQPDKRQFGSMWLASMYSQETYLPYPPYVYPESYSTPTFYPYQPAQNINLGNFQRIWKDITEDSSQYFVNLKFPFEQWSGDEGYLKFGVFNDVVNRDYQQKSFKNDITSVESGYPAPWEAFWSQVFPPDVTRSDTDIDYHGKQNISAWYYMADLPLCSWFKLIGGVRYEKTELSIENFPYNESAAKIILPPESAPQDYNASLANVSFKQDDVLPSIGFEYKPFEKTTLRGSYSETVARQTFKELSPIEQMEYLGGDVFIGNPKLKMSSLRNYDLRLDYTPSEGSLISLSYFYKDIKDPIEYVQGNAGFAYTYPVNYPQGKLSGFEVELRQKMGRLRQELEGLSLGANATFIDSEVTLPRDEAESLRELKVPMPTRDMVNTPNHLYNLYMTYDIKQTDTQLGLFYTVKGDTLLAGGGQSNGHFVPDVYALEYGTLNFTASQKIWKIWKLRFQAKNLLDPDIDTVYRSKYIGDDVTKTSFRRGKEFSISLSASF